MWQNISPEMCYLSSRYTIRISYIIFDIFVGAGVHSGHYTAMVMRGADWWYMNDQFVTKKDETKAWKSSESYILFYTRDCTI